MASAAALGPYSRALALSSKGIELQLRGHAERSRDKFRDALAAARAVGAEDCLVTAMLTAEEAIHDVRTLVRLPRERLMTPLERLSFADKLRECAEAVTGAAAVARRRCAAGTHQSAEQAWYEAHLAAGWCARGSSESKAMEDAKHVAPLSCDTAVIAACASYHVLEFATKQSLFSASELSTRLSAMCDLVDEAVVLVGPRRVEGTFSAYAGAMKACLRSGIELWRQQSSMAAHATRLAEALQLLCLHGTLRADDQALADKELTDARAKVIAAESAASAPELLRCCALASCGTKEAHEKHFSKCAACKTVVYCSKTCQVADWPAHKKACKAAEAAESAAASNAA